MDPSSVILVRDIVNMVLASVALIVTVVGFFASLYFYRHGVNLQNDAHNTLTSINEKTGSIQSHMEGVFDKTLEVALGRPNETQPVKNKTS